MATVLNLGLINAFNIIFPFILVLALVFAILQQTKAVSDKAGINAIIAVAAAFLVILSDTVMQLINFMIPWFTVAIIFLILVLLIFKMFGAIDFSEAIKIPTVHWTIIGIAIIILLAAFANVLGQQLTNLQFEETNTTIAPNGATVGGSSFDESLLASLFHPKIIGMLVLFAIAIFAVILLSG